MHESGSDRHNIILKSLRMNKTASALSRRALGRARAVWGRGLRVIDVCGLAGSQATKTRRRAIRCNGAHALSVARCCE